MHQICVTNGINPKIDYLWDKSMGMAIIYFNHKVPSPYKLYNLNRWITKTKCLLQINEDVYHFYVSNTVDLPSPPKDSLSTPNKTKTGSMVGRGWVEEVKIKLTVLYMILFSFNIHFFLIAHKKHLFSIFLFYIIA